jgi:hypothetical protein
MPEKIFVTRGVDVHKESMGYEAGNMGHTWEEG